MASKVTAIIAKVHQERSKGNYDKALKRLKDGISKVPNDIELYEEAIDVSLESGESRQAIHYFKIATRIFAAQEDGLWNFSVDKTKVYNDPIFGKFLVEQAIKKRELTAALSVLSNLKDHTAGELLKRIRTKQRTLTTAISGGYSLRGDLLLYAFAEALLCFRMKRFQEAAKSFVHILDGKPVEHQVIHHFLTGQADYARKSGVTFAVGCCHFAAQKYEKAFHEIVNGVRTSPSFAADAITKLETARGIPAVTQSELDLALAELHIINKDDQKSVEMIRGILSACPERSPAIIGMFETNMDLIADNIDLLYLYIDAALNTERNNIALAQLRKMRQDRRLVSNLLSWLDDKASNSTLPLEILSLYGDLCLQQGMFGKGVEILRSVLYTAPHESASVSSLLSKYRADAEVAKLYDEITRIDEPPTQGESAGIDIQHFESREFSLSGEPAGDGEIVQQEEPDLSRSAPPAPDDQQLNDPAGVDPHAADEAVLADDHSELRLETADEAAAAPDSSAVRSQLLDPAPPVNAEVRSHPTAATTPVENRKTGDNLTEQAPPSGEEVILLGDSTEAPAETRPTAAPDKPRTEKPEAPAPIGRSNTAEIEIPEEDSDNPDDDFDVLFERFEKGQLDNNGILDLIQSAIKKEFWDEARALLRFEPKNVGEEVKRKYFLAEYYINEGRPLPALITLKTVQLNGLSKEERKSFLLKIARCYQDLRNFEAAHGTFLRIMSEHPNFLLAENMAKSNYARYIEELSLAAPALEKVTTF